jgi:carboxymethylenebutenolidase
MFEASHLQHNIVSGYIQIVSDGHYLPAFWSHPDLGGPFPGLVMLHSEWGLTPTVRSQARRLAQQGYYVIAPDLFNRQIATSETRARELIAALGAVAQSWVTATLHALQSHHKCNRTVGLVGWGFGGLLALRTASLRDDLDVVVSLYGLPEDFKPTELLLLTCPLLVLLGEDDPANPPALVTRLRQAMANSDLPHDLILYPGVGRNFCDDSRPEFAPDTADMAWSRLVEFLHAHLDPGPHPDHRPDAFDPGDVY